MSSPSDRLTGFSSAFDELLERSRRELDALSGGSGAPAPSPGGPRMSPHAPAAVSGTTRSAPPRAPSPAAPRSPAERTLDEKLGPGWRQEILDRTREGDELIVRCRVTAPARGLTRTWFGSAPLSGAGRGGASGVAGTAGNVRFTASTGARAETAPATSAATGTRPSIATGREAGTGWGAERQAVEAALAACARLL